MLDEIIVAIATAQGTGGIAIIRACGDGIINLMEKFVSSSKLQNNKYKELFLTNFTIDNEVVDQVLISKFEKGSSFTGEETIEINCHGGVYVTNLILAELLKLKDVRLAQPGEFTKIAFLNKKMNLNQAQGIMDLINAHNQATHQLALDSFKNKNLVQLNNIYNDLMDIITIIEVGIDYPEYNDIEEFKYKELVIKINQIQTKITSVIKVSKDGQLLKSGINTVLVGKPNVGKSTLLNLLSKNQKALVSSIAGTTRDVVEAEILIGNLKLNLFDTAGIRDSVDEIEKMGIKKSYEFINQADLVIFIMDATTELTKEEEELYKLIQNKKYLILNNKIEIGKNKFYHEEIKISFHETESIKLIEDEIIKLFDLKMFDAMNNSGVNNIVHIQKLIEAKEILDDVIEGLDIFQPLDLIEIDIKEVMYLLGEILNKQVKSDLLDEMFSRFCLGK